MAQTMVRFDTEDPGFDRSKYIRQLRAVVRWKRFKGRGSLELATGFGKSITACIALQKLKKNKPKFRSLVTVPTTQLKKQWESLLEWQGLSDNVKVFVVNTIALRNSIYRNIDLLIVDEAHLTPGDQFFTIFRKIEYKFLMPLTGTMFRLDGRDAWITNLAPVCDKVTVKEAVDNGWLSPHYQINLSVALRREESQRLVNIGKQIRFYMSGNKFGITGNAFSTMLSCMDKRNAYNFAQRYNHDHKEVIKWAVNCKRLIDERLEVMNNCEQKVEAAAKLINELGVRTITFSQSIAFVESLGKKLNKPFSEYHSKIPSKDIPEFKRKSYKTRKAAEKFAFSKNASVDVETLPNGKINYVVCWSKLTRFSGSRINDMNLKQYSGGKVKTLLSAKALNQGFDDESTQLGIRASGTESYATYEQQLGRAIRNFKVDGKQVPKLFINLYIPDWCVSGSIDHSKLVTSQCNQADVMFMDDIDEVISLVKRIVNR